MPYLLVEGQVPPLFVHSRCEDELLLFAEDAARDYPARAVVGSYEVEPRITIGELKRAYRQDQTGFRRLLGHRRRILQHGWRYPQWSSNSDVVKG